MDPTQNGQTGLFGLDPNLLMNLGVGLLSAGAKNSPMRGNLGLGLASGLQGYQQNRAANQQNQMAQLQMGLTKAQFQAEMPIYQALGQKLHQMNQDPSTPALAQNLLSGAAPVLPGMPQPQGPPPGTQPPGMPPSGAPMPPAGPPPSMPTGQGAAPMPAAGVPPAQAPQGQPNRYRAPAPLPPVGGNPLGDVQMGTMLSYLPQFKGASEALMASPKNLQAAQELQVKQRQQQLAEPMSILDTTASAANADQIVKNDPELVARWQEVAPRLGLNPDSSLTPDNARAFARYAYNELAGSAQQPAKPMPEIYDTYPGANGQLLQRERSTGKISEPVPQKLPTFAMEKRWNPQTGKDEGVMVQTSPGGSAAPAGILGGNQPNVPRGTASRASTPQPNRSTSQPNSAPGGGLGQQATAPVDLGFEKPNAENLKAAQFANYARNSNPLLQQLENSGYRMSPTARTVVIDAAVNDEPGKVSQWVSQEALAHKLSSQDTTYMSALMPLLQAAGHSMSGARLTQSQMRTNFESLIPVASDDPKYIQSVQGNRQNLYKGLLAQTGSAAQMPEFRSTLGSDRAAISLPKTNAQGWALHRDKGGNLAYVSPDGKQVAEVHY